MSGERVGFTGAEALELPGWRHVYSGKVRDLYEPCLLYTSDAADE